MRVAISKFADKFKLKFKSLFYAQGPEMLHCGCIIHKNLLNRRCSRREVGPRGFKKKKLIIPGHFLYNDPDEGTY